MPGEEPFLSVGTFVDADEVGATVETQQMTRSGEPIGEATSARSTWVGFQAHASYPAGRITEESLTLGGTAYACWRYDVDDDEATVAWFAKDLPGPPVRMTRSLGETVVFRMSLLSVTGR